MSTTLVVPLREGLHDLTWNQRIVWGRCPVCSAAPGERCHANVGLTLGVGVDGGPPVDGVHLGRLNAAPARVRIEGLR